MILSRVSGILKIQGNPLMSSGTILTWKDSLFVMIKIEIELEVGTDRKALLVASRVVKKREEMWMIGSFQWIICDALGVLGFIIVICIEQLICIFYSSKPKYTNKFVGIAKKNASTDRKFRHL